MHQDKGSLNASDEHGGPLVSILTPYLNVGKFLEEAIESVLAQSYAHWELLLIDDGSSDGGPDIALRYAARHPTRIRTLEHAGHAHLGLSASLNVGIRHAGGRYITFLDADDAYFPGTLERQVAILEAQPEAQAVYGPYQVWYSWTGEPQDEGRDYIRRPGIQPGTLHRPPALLQHGLRGDWISKPGTSSLMVRREAFALVGAFEPETFREVGPDLVFWTRLSLHAPVFVTDECLFRYRQHPDSTYTVALREGRYAAFQTVFLSWLKEYLEAEEIEDPKLWKAVRTCERNWNRGGRFAVLRWLVHRCLPFHARQWLYYRWLSWRTSRSR